MLVLLGVAFVIWYIWYVTKLRRRSSHSSNDKGFSQAGVQVTFSDGTIKINGKTYPVAAVRGIRWVSGEGPYGNVSRAIISLDDFNHPLHEIAFIQRKAGEAFVQRLSLAIEKAGGPKFT